MLNVTSLIRNLLAICLISSLCDSYFSVADAFSSQRMFERAAANNAGMTNHGSTRGSSSNRSNNNIPRSSTTIIMMAGTTVAPPPTETETEKKKKQGGDETNLPTIDDIRRDGPLEYLEDDPTEERNMDDPFHILLLGETFEKRKMTVTYVAGSLNYVLDIPIDEATELTQFAHDEGISCLGTWKREKCLELGKKLQIRDIVCRVVPYCEGGQRGWQAKNANNDAYSNNNLGGGNGGGGGDWA